ncbi:MAG: hypothetical protein NVV74_21650 [Magnetospirillum sp.]|nr:hypothetical protein [Magnetospirillum sp.]
MIRPQSLVSRYFLVSLVAAMVPLAAVGYLYDTYAQDMLRALTGQRLSAQLTATASRLGAFFDSRIYQLDTLSNYPSLASYVDRAEREDSEIAALLRIEADVPDLYGIWFFDRAGRLSRVIAGQAASGAPYWMGEAPDISHLPKARVGSTEILGPVPPRDGAPGWFLMHQVLRDQHSGEENGTIALHVRLASVTELMGAPEIGSLIQPVLITPGGGIFDSVGRFISPPRRSDARPRDRPRLAGGPGHPAGRPAGSVHPGAALVVHAGAQLGDRGGGAVRAPVEQAEAATAPSRGGRRRRIGGTAGLSSARDRQ